MAASQIEVPKEGSFSSITRIDRTIFRGIDDQLSRKFYKLCPLVKTPEFLGRASIQIQTKGLKFTPSETKVVGSLAAETFEKESKNVQIRMLGVLISTTMTYYEKLVAMQGEEVGQAEYMTETIKAHMVAMAYSGMSNLEAYLADVLAGTPATKYNVSTDINKASDRDICYVKKLLSTAKAYEIADNLYAMVKKLQAKSEDYSNPSENIVLAIGEELESLLMKKSAFNEVRAIEELQRDFGGKLRIVSFRELGRKAFAVIPNANLFGMFLGQSAVVHPDKIEVGGDGTKSSTSIFSDMYIMNPGITSVLQVAA